MSVLMKAATSFYFWLDPNPSLPYNDIQGLVELSEVRMITWCVLNKILHQHAISISILVCVMESRESTQKTVEGEREIPK